MSGRSVVIKGESGGAAAVVQTCRVSSTSALHTTAGDASSGPLDAGLSFHAQYINPALADAANLDVLLIVPAEGLMQVGISFALGGDGTMLFYEDAVVSANGTALLEVNRNRNSPNVATLEAYHSPTVTDVGTLLSGTIIPGGEGKKDSVGSGGGQADVILKKGATYLLRITNDSGAVQPAVMSVNWVEDLEG